MIEKKWTVNLDGDAIKQTKKLPREVVHILYQLRWDLERQGPLPRGWLVKHVHGMPGVYAARLKREYRALYEVKEPEIIILKVSHRKEAY